MLASAGQKLKKRKNGKKNKEKIYIYNIRDSERKTKKKEIYKTEHEVELCTQKKRVVTQALCIRMYR